MAGLIEGEGEGEGTITIYKSKVSDRGRRVYGKRNPMYKLIVKIPNTIEEMIDFCINEFGGTKTVKKARRLKKNGETLKRQWVWILSGRNSYRLLKRLLPYMICKKDQATLGIEFYKKCYLRRIKDNSEIPLWMIKKREEYYQKIKRCIIKFSERRVTPL